MQKVHKVGILHQIEFLNYAALKIPHMCCPADSCHGHYVPKIFYFVFPIVNQQRNFRVCH